MSDAPKPRVAYTVREDSEGHAVVVFATNGAAARRSGANELNLSFEEVESCRRSPEFDAYAEAGEVPPLVAIACGWWFECQHCNRQVDEYTEAPVADGQTVYCSPSHRMAEWVERRDRERREAASIEACAIKYHGWPISNLRGVRHHDHRKGCDPVDACDFDFPGRAGLPARWDIGDDQVWISECDREAFNDMQAKFGRKTAVTA